MENSGELLNECGVVIVDWGDGCAVCGCCNEWINYWTATITSLVEEDFGRAKLVRNQTNVLALGLAGFSLMWVR